MKPAACSRSNWMKCEKINPLTSPDDMGMDQYLLIPFLGGWTSMYQLFWRSPGVQGFDTLSYHKTWENTSVLIQDNQNCLTFERVNAMPWGLMCFCAFMEGWVASNVLSNMGPEMFRMQNTRFPCGFQDLGFGSSRWFGSCHFSMKPLQDGYQIRSPSGNNSNGSRQVQSAENAAGNITWADHRHRPIGIATTNSLGKRSRNSLRRFRGFIEGFRGDRWDNKIRTCHE